MKKEEFIKIIDGELYYKYDYTYWLYNQLEIRDNIINKAIEYIETNIEDEYEYIGLLYDNEDKQKLLDILKGVDKE